MRNLPTEILDKLYKLVPDTLKSIRATGRINKDIADQQIVDKCRIQYGFQPKIYLLLCYETAEFYASTLPIRSQPDYPFSSTQSLAVTHVLQKSKAGLTLQTRNRPKTKALIAAFECLENSAAKDYFLARIILHLSADLKEKKTAIELLQNAAEAKYPLAQRDLGYLYHKGLAEGYSPCLYSKKNKAVLLNKDLPKAKQLFQEYLESKPYDASAIICQLALIGFQQKPNNFQETESYLQMADECGDNNAALLEEELNIAAKRFTRFS